jgi:hypothetical protein
VNRSKKKLFSDIDELRVASAADTISFLFQRCPTFRSVPAYDLGRIKAVGLNQVLWVDTAGHRGMESSSTAVSASAGSHRVESARGLPSTGTDAPPKKDCPVSSIVLIYRSTTSALLSRRIASATGIDAATPRLMLDVSQALSDLDELVAGLRQELRAAHANEEGFEGRLRSMQQELNVLHAQHGSLSKELAANRCMTQMLQEELQDHRVLKGLTAGRSEEELEEHVRKFINAATNSSRPLRHIGGDHGDAVGMQRRVLPPSSPATRELFRHTRAPSPPRRRRF